MRERAWRGRVIAVCVGSILSVACTPENASSPTGSTSGKTASTRLTNANVVYMRTLPGFVERERLFVAGIRHPDGGCEYRSQRHLKKGQSEAERVVEMDTAACSFVAARGDFVAPPLPDSVKTSVDTIALPKAGEAGARLGVRSTARSSSGCGEIANLSTAGMTLTVFDPIVIPVNRDVTEFTWWNNGYCVYAPTGLHVMTWFLLTNWSRIYWGTPPFQFGYFGSDSDPDYLITGNWSVYSNPGFQMGFPACSAPVASFLLPNKIYGYSHGSASFESGINISGPGPYCVDLLDRVITRYVQ